MKEILGIDLGGTNFKVGLVRNGVVVNELHHPIQSSQTEGQLLKDLFALIQQVKTEATQAMGVGVPGIVDPKTGIIYDIQNIPAWKKVPLERHLENQFGLPVAMNNDANCFALGEKKYGVAQHLSDFVGLSMGTGIGMGVVSNNELVNGVLCGAGEIGMVPYKDSIVENYASSFFFAREYNTSGKELFKQAVAGERKAMVAFEKFGVHLGEAIKICMFMYAPEAIILGGSISKAYSLFEASMQATIASFPYKMQLEQMEIKVSETSNVAILGAAALCSI